MERIKLVVEIGKGDYELLQQKEYIDLTYYESVILNGTVISDQTEQEEKQYCTENVL